MTHPNRVRVLLFSPERRLLLFRYRHTGPDGIDRPAWVTTGGGCDPGETVEQTALRELAEETGIEGIQLGPIVWYGEDAHRGAPWSRVYREHFIVAHAPHETIETAGWTEGEREEIIDMRWWTVDELRASREPIYPFGLADRVEPLLRGEYPSAMITLPTLTPEMAPF